MTESKFLKPAPGLKVRTPTGEHLPEGGDEVGFTSYWRRRLRVGDVVEARRPRANKSKEK